MSYTNTFLLVKGGIFPKRVCLRASIGVWGPMILQLLCIYYAKSKQETGTTISTNSCWLELHPISWGSFRDALWRRRRLWYSTKAGLHWGCTIWLVLKQQVLAFLKKHCYLTYLLNLFLYLTYTYTCQYNVKVFNNLSSHIIFVQVCHHVLHSNEFLAAYFSV